ncbi:MAG TPA: TetR/AcrR family transcriptional regulator [Parvularculaceae bacterium]|nr:TetR/AcrR family transcriptional regulator [Parvularculaceae bacterium]
MARKQAPDYEEKRDAIVDEAAKLFAEKGFAGASLADLAYACDMSKSLFYHYYPSKEAILYAVMKGHMDDLLTAVDDAKSAAPDSLGAFARRLLRLYAGAAAKQKVLLYELANLPKAERDEIVAKERRLIAHVEGLIADARPGVGKARLKATAMLFFGMLNWTHTWLKPSGAVSRDDVADMAAKMALADG